MDRRQLVAKIVERSGAKLDPDDPAFLLVELNHLAFDELANELADDIIAKLNVATDKFGDITTRGVDDFVSVANEALSKFIGRTNEIKALLEISQTLPPTNSVASIPVVPNAKKEPPSALLWWPVAMAFMVGALGGVLATVLALQ
jgi:hypothetical protein